MYPQVRIKMLKIIKKEILKINNDVKKLHVLIMN